jgi:DNA-directed RNA polymerase subunit RPC12/RpoP
VKCPNCGASVDPMTAKVIEGKPYVTCDHCGTRFELTEEPTW